MGVSTHYKKRKPRIKLEQRVYAHYGKRKYLSQLWNSDLRMARKWRQKRLQLQPTNVLPIADREKQDDCARELKVFLKGGRCGLYVLSRCWKTIMRQYGIDYSMHRTVLLKAGLHLNFGELKSIHSSEYADAEVLVC